jgi:hypothetical protein
MEYVLRYSWWLGSRSSDEADTFVTFWPAAVLLVIVVLLLAALIGVVDLVWQSKVKRVPITNGSVLIYLLLLFLGDIFASASALVVVRPYIARAAAEASAPSEGGARLGSAVDGPRTANSTARTGKVVDDSDQWPWEATVILSAFVGVFGFQAVIKNINISAYGKGFLTLDDWISKARDNAIADVLEQDTKRTAHRLATLAEGLRKLPTPTLNSLVVDILGHASVAEFEKKASDGNADAALIKAYALARHDPVRAAAHAPRY